MKILNFFKNLFRRKVKVAEYKPSKESTELNKVFEDLPLWTPELIEWIGKENDPVVLATTSCLINTYKWPDYLPGKPPENQNRKHNHFACDVMRLLDAKSERIAPGLNKKIWLTGYYKKCPAPVK